MHSFVEIVVLTLLALAHAKELAVSHVIEAQNPMHTSVDDLLSKVADGMAERSLKAPALRKTRMDSTTLGKASHLAMHTSHSSPLAASFETRFSRDHLTYSHPPSARSQRTPEVSTQAHSGINLEVAAVSGLHGQFFPGSSAFSAQASSENQILEASADWAKSFKNVPLEGLWQDAAHPGAWRRILRRLDDSYEVVGEDWGWDSAKNRAFVKEDGQPAQRWGPLPVSSTEEWCFPSEANGISRCDTVVEVDFGAKGEPNKKGIVLRGVISWEDGNTWSRCED
eukprot:gnl/TRDRNA2_/TRDRNA2_91590_c0_seq1.p1 gnl/TRDRNA2_/TRDRNA2_91590_c0~~gnl/TRDRNA2_/TRDRNA2_91590_c0_seq1.p1  ORF type:complete len:282 (-),score=38.01 gnl/TRDRNA2_/TRDRNA2_91590_c0_seq1:97-942(-)